MLPVSDPVTNPPQVAVFDLGKVLLDFNYGILARKIAARSHATEAEVRKLTDHSPLLFRYETGQMRRREFFEAIKSATGFDGSLADFEPIFSDIFVPIPKMIELNAVLRKRGIPTYIFSNTNDLAIEHIRREYPFFKNFDGYIFSFEHGSMKPDAKIYEVVEQSTGCRGPEILYLDDRAENVAAGTARGWRAILHETPEITCEAIRDAGWTW